MTSLLTALSTVVVPLVDAAPAPEDVRPGWLAFGLIIALAVATLLLWLNMRKQINKIDFDDGSTPPESPNPSADHPGTAGTNSADSPTA